MMQNSKKTPNQRSLAIPTTNALQAQQRSPMLVPLLLEPFASSFSAKELNGEFLGATSPSNQTNQRKQFSQIRSLAKVNYQHHLIGKTSLDPSPHALERTRQAAKDFFCLSYQLLELEGGEFPLAGRNKCLGMVAVPTTKVVIIAVSQDKQPSKDELLRNNMVEFLKKLNKNSNNWVFELACIPTKAQYLLPRTLSVRKPQAAHPESVKPHTRCVEVALMAALCKAGRTLKFTSEDTGIIAFGGTLWGSKDGNDAIPHFGKIDRNTKHNEPNPLEVELAPNLIGYIDVWKPCKEHCAIYKYEMLAIGASGGGSSSFFEPRSEGLEFKKQAKLNKTEIRPNQATTLKIGCTFMGVILGVSGTYFYNNQNSHNNYGANVFVSLSMFFATMMLMKNSTEAKNKVTTTIEVENRIEPRRQVRSVSF
jgi:hypothetical protein